MMYTIGEKPECARVLDIAMKRARAQERKPWYIQMIDRIARFFIL